MSGSRPDPSECVYAGTFAVANESAVYVGGFARYHACLTDGELWLSDELSIPIHAIRGREIIEHGMLIKRRALRIVFEDVETKQDVMVHLCDVSILGFYRRRLLEELMGALDGALRRVGRGGVATGGADAPLPKKRMSGAVLHDLFASRESLEIEVSLDVARQAGLDVGETFPSAEEARLRIGIAAREKGLHQLPATLGSVVGRAVVARRLIAAWVAFWLYIAPVAAVAVFVLTRPLPEVWDAQAVISTALICFFSWVVALTISMLVQQVLGVPFRVMLNLVLRSGAKHE